MSKYLTKFGYPALPAPKRTTMGIAASYMRHNRYGANLRLEQERIGFGWVRNALDRL